MFKKWLFKTSTEKMQKKHCMKLTYHLPRRPTILRFRETLCHFWMLSFPVSNVFLYPSCTRHFTPSITYSPILSSQIKANFPMGINKKKGKNKKHSNQSQSMTNSWLSSLHPNPKAKLNPQPKLINQAQSQHGMIVRITKNDSKKKNYNSFS